MLKRSFTAFLPLLLLVAIPVLMRTKPVAPGADDLTLVIITPHNESIRFEFSRAFDAYCFETRGKHVNIDWRMPGGTSDIARYLDDQFTTAFRRYWTAAHGPFTAEVAKAFNDRKLDLDDPQTTVTAAAARRAFLDSDVGIGVDLFFGGGQYDMNMQAQMGHAVDAGLIAKHPEWFAAQAGGSAAIPAAFTGELFYDPGGRYYGTCLSAFGICYNIDRLALLADAAPPTTWQSLGEPRFFAQVAVADPTKSGSITKCFEMLIQEQMSAAVSDLGEAEGKAEGWRQGLNLIKRIGGNSLYFTESASKVPLDVGRGNATAGMCIDFYGRAQAEFTGSVSGRECMRYVTPRGGSSISADPIQLLRGAPHRELAIAFIEFVLSDAGQQLWNYRPGAPGGPTTYSIRRLPVRRDMYTPAHQQYMVDAAENPFEAAKDFQYHGGWTGPYFGLVRILIKAMVLDPRDELIAAWQAIIEAGGPAAVPEAMAAFNAMPFEYDEAAAARDRATARDNVEALRVIRGWSEFFRAQYLEAARLARRGRG